jgi:hypothetical protein
VRGEILTGINGSERYLIPASDLHGDSGIVIALLCVALFMLVNPFLAVFIVAMIAAYRPIPASIFIIAASISFAAFFNFREYGVDWYFNSSDDVPIYLAIYRDIQAESFSDLFVNFFTAPNGNELLWCVPCWLLANVFDASEDTFIFLHYLFIFFFAFLALYSLSRKYLVALVLVYLLLTPISIDSIAHIWRQQLAFSMFLAGVGLHLVRGLRIGKWLIFMSPLMHLALVFFVLGFLVFKLIKNENGFDNKLKFSVALALLMGAVPLLSSIAVTYLDSIGLSRILSYFEGTGEDVTRVYMILGIYAVPMLAVFYFLKNDDPNNLFLILSFSVFSIVSALPAANGIYDRLLMFVLPLMGIYFFRSLLINFSSRYQVLILTAVFISGIARLYEPTRDQSGTMYFLAFGNAFDPSMGLMKMLLSF